MFWRGNEVLLRSTKYIKFALMLSIKNMCLMYIDFFHVYAVICLQKHNYVK